jgi:hypothetical protein
MPWLLYPLIVSLLLRRFVWWVFIGSLPFAALAWYTGDRRFYFPFAMQMAAQVTVLSAERWSMLLLSLAAFLIIRVFQDATRQVLVVEALVGAALLAICIGLSSRLQPVTLGVLASLLSMVGLLF